MMRRAAIGTLRRTATAAPELTVPSVTLVDDAVSAADEARLVAQADRWLARTRVQPGHFDRVISHYRELQKPLAHFDAASRAILEPLVRQAFPTDLPLLPVHLLDLEPEGTIDDHVDHVEYSGSHIAGLCLLSHAVMTLRHSETGSAVDLLLPRRSLYVLQGPARYDWGHSIGAHPTFEGERLERKGRRLSLLFRDAPARAP